jgi:predicted aldo/keto reductase-like oxidoreductase
MIEENNYQTIPSEEQMIKQVDEQKLQAITGGCSGCVNVAMESTAQQNAIIQHFNGQQRSLYHNAQNTLLNAAREYGVLANNALQSAGKPPRAGCVVCEDHPRHANALQQLNTRMFGGR